MNKSKLTELLRYAWLEGRTNGLQNNGKSFSEFLELKEVSEAINDTHSCTELKDKETMPFDVWFDKNVVESKDGKYYVDGERLRFYELVSKHKTECLLDL